MPTSIPLLVEHHNKIVLVPKHDLVVFCGCLCAKKPILFVSRHIDSIPSSTLCEQQDPLFLSSIMSLRIAPHVFRSSSVHPAICFATTANLSESPLIPLPIYEWTMTQVSCVFVHRLDHPTPVQLLLRVSTASGSKGFSKIPIFWKAQPQDLSYIFIGPCIFGQGLSRVKIEP